MVGEISRCVFFLVMGIGVRVFCEKKFGKGRIGVFGILFRVDVLLCIRTRGYATNKMMQS